MASERVDKSWRTKGLEAYSTEAILGTLSHYGVTVDEAGYRALAEERYPLHIATGWMPSWKGVGQFAGYPLAAAETLWTRWFPDRTAPVTVTKSLLTVLEAYARLLKGEKEAPVGEATTKFDALLAQAPKKDGALDNAFAEEVLTRLDPETLRAFDEMAEALAKQGQGEQAMTFARLEEALIPERRGVATAIVQAVLGEKAPAVEKLVAQSKDESISTDRRVLAVDALIHIGAHPEAEARAKEMFDAAEKAEDFHLGLDLAGRLEHLYSKRRAEAELRDLINRAQKLHEAHSKAHPHHGH